MKVYFQFSISLQVPAWRPVVHKGVSRLILHIREEVNTMQYDNPNIPDVEEVFGSVICKVLSFLYIE